MATAASGAGSEGDFEPPPPSLVEHGGGSDSGQGGGLVFGGGGGHLDPLRHGRASPAPALCGRWCRGGRKRRGERRKKREEEEERGERGVKEGLASGPLHAKKR